MDSKILNPATGRYVNKHGKIGRQLLSHTSPEKLRTSILINLRETCNNDADPISMDDFEDMSLEDLRNIVKIGGDTGKKNCYTLENIYEVYKIAIMSQKQPRDPMDPGHILTPTEIQEINHKMKAKVPGYKPPKYVKPKPYPKGYELVIESDPLVGNFFWIKIHYRHRVMHDLGYVPAWVETYHTGSTDHTSAVVVSNIRELWDKRLLTNDIESCCDVPLRIPIVYWQTSQWKSRFIDFCETVKGAHDK